jgi:hypothetical protein
VNQFTLQPNEIRQVPLSGRYLVARTITGNIVISDPTLGLPEFTIKQSDNVEFEQSRSVTVRNAGAAVATVELQSSPVKIFSNDGGSVKISGGSIDSILTPISVTAEATVENGTVTSQSPNVNSQSNDVVVAAGATVTVLVANGAVNRRVVIVQNISAAFTQVRVSASPAVNRGALLAGSIDAISSLEIETVAEIKAYNASATPATLTVSWGQR